VGDTSFPSVRFATTVRFIPKKGRIPKKVPLSGVLSTKMTLFGWRAGIQTRCCAAVLGQTPLSHQKTFPSDTLIGGQKPPRFTSNRSPQRGRARPKNLILTDRYSGLTC
jgi:hypothetical protein